MVDAKTKTLEGSFKRFRFSWSLSISRINNLIRSVIWMLIVNHSLYSLKAKGEKCYISHSKVGLYSRNFSNVIEMTSCSAWLIESASKSEQLESISLREIITSTFFIANKRLNFF